MKQPKAANGRSESDCDEGAARKGASTGRGAASNVGPVLQHVGGTTVPQQMAAFRLAIPAAYEAASHPIADVTGTEPLAVSAQKQRSFAGFQLKLRTAPLQVAAQPTHSI